MSNNIPQIQFSPNCSPIEAISSLLLRASGHYCPADNCSYCCHKKSVMEKHLKMKDGDKDDCDKYVCIVQRGFGKSDIRVIEVKIQQWHMILWIY
jgi:hypothetical protein